MLYNRVPSSPSDLLDNLSFQSTNNPQCLETERQWKNAFRRYIEGCGIPTLAIWAGTEGNFSHPASRARLFVCAVTGTEMMPFGKSLKVCNIATDPNLT
jgi:hypothetical protein